MIVHLALHNYTFCGKDIDFLRAQESLMLIQTSLDEDFALVSRFKCQPLACKICLNELAQEERLILEKYNLNSEEIDEPII